jgi:hypothetical protein
LVEGEVGGLRLVKKDFREGREFVKFVNLLRRGGRVATMSLKAKVFIRCVFY